MTDAQWKRFLARSEKKAFQNVDPSAFTPKKTYTNRTYRRGAFLNRPVTPTFGT